MSIKTKTKDKGERKMKKRFTTININGENFELDNKETVKNPVVFYKSVYECYGRCSSTKQSIWES